jgi:hypothetical protein
LCNSLAYSAGGKFLSAASSSRRRRIAASELHPSFRKRPLAITNLPICQRLFRFLADLHVHDRTAASSSCRTAWTRVSSHASRQSM